MDDLTGSPLYQSFAPYSCTIDFSQLDIPTPELTNHIIMSDLNELSITPLVYERLKLTIKLLMDRAFVPIALTRLVPSSKLVFSNWSLGTWIPIVSSEFASPAIQSDMLADVRRGVRSWRVIEYVIRTHWMIVFNRMVQLYNTLIVTRSIAWMNECVQWLLQPVPSVIPDLMDGLVNNEFKMKISQSVRTQPIECSCSNDVCECELGWIRIPLHRSVQVNGCIMIWNASRNSVWVNIYSLKELDSVVSAMIMCFPIVQSKRSDTLVMINLFYTSDWTNLRNALALDNYDRYGHISCLKSGRINATPRIHLYNSSDSTLNFRIRTPNLDHLGAHVWALERMSGLVPLVGNIYRIHDIERVRLLIRLYDEPPMLCQHEWMQCQPQSLQHRLNHTHLYITNVSNQTVCVKLTSSIADILDEVSVHILVGLGDTLDHIHINIFR